MIDNLGILFGSEAGWRDEKQNRTKDVQTPRELESTKRDCIRHLVSVNAFISTRGMSLPLSVHSTEQK